ncbi:DUF4411 family protein, partial [Psychrobacter sp. FME5]|uniref:DUF4411 family protein n=1 Tax=Psychrobacter sp. FME5 TaxID=2487706 RepID=UPI00178858E2
MIKYCIDTNAILDLCYRYYPSSIFSNIWDMLEGCVLSRQIKIIGGVLKSMLASDIAIIDIE